MLTKWRRRIFPKDYKKIAIIQAPGTNCDAETFYCVFKSGFDPVKVKLRDCIYSSDLFSEIRGLIFPGGFTYGDYLGSGVIFSFIVKTKLEDTLNDFIRRKGKILGICNGFQILARLSILPFPGKSPSMSLEENERGRFECRWVPIKKHDSKIQTFRELPGKFHLPVAHMEGRVVFKDDNSLEKIIAGDQIVFSYGEGGENVKYPQNPNGSIMSIAGVTDPTGSVLGLMPHPERFLDKNQYPFEDWRFEEPLGVTFMKMFFKNAEE
ncbi:phosphoribosylformylglycinamidine synthase I [candidate division WOR-3 bacterium]|nr:phosphoribosylformylglycinamidine synthase I [candidate division WOR-3 bacterium]